MEKNSIIPNIVWEQYEKIALDCENIGQIFDKSGAFAAEQIKSFGKLYNDLINEAKKK